MVTIISRTLAQLALISVGWLLALGVAAQAPNKDCPKYGQTGYHGAPGTEEPGNAGRNADGKVAGPVTGGPRSTDDKGIVSVGLGGGASIQEGLLLPCPFGGLLAFGGEVALEDLQQRQYPIGPLGWPRPELKILNKGPCPSPRCFFAHLAPGIFTCICEPYPPLRIPTPLDLNGPPSNYAPQEQYATPTGWGVVCGAPGSGRFDHFYYTPDPATGARQEDFWDQFNVDGSVTRFRKVVVPGSASVYSNYDFWVTEWTVDAYDNKTLFEYDEQARIRRIRRPDGVDEIYDYSPSSLLGTSSDKWDPAAYSALEIRYELIGVPAADLADYSIRYLFERVGPQTRPFAGDRLVRTYGARMPMLTAKGANGLYELPAGLTATDRYHVTELSYVAGRVSEVRYFVADSLSPQAATTSSVSSTKFTYVEIPAGSGVYRVKDETYASGTAGEHTWTFNYGADSANPHRLLWSERTCSETQTTVKVHFDSRNRPELVITTPLSSSGGLPRAADPDAAGADEPVQTTLAYVYGSCGVCDSKPTIITDQTSGREWRWEYDSVSGLVVSHSYPSPSGSGVATEQFFWQPLVTGQLYKGYRLHRRDDAAGQSWVTSYPIDIPRVDPAHGVKAQVVLQTSPSVSTTTPAAPVTTTTIIDCTPRPLVQHSEPAPTGWLIYAGGWHQGRVTGQVENTIDGDGVHTQLTYNGRGYLDAIVRGYNAASSIQVRTEFVYDDFGRPTLVKDRVGSNTEQALSLEYNSAGRVTRTSASVGGQVHEERFFYDMFGNLAVHLRKNRDAAGGPPVPLQGAATTAREWIHDEWHYTLDRLDTEFEDRRPLHEGDGGPVADAVDARFLRTDLTWLPRGLVSSIGKPNGSTVDLTYDGYGTLYKRVLRGMAGEELVSRSFINDALEPVRLIEGVGASKLVTTIDRNAAGVVEVVHEPGVAHPGGSYPSTFGVKFARHEFDTDILGQTIEARIVDATNSALMRKVKSFYDELGRVYRIEMPDVLGGPDTAVQQVAWTGASKATQVTDSAGRFVKRTFDALGRVTQVEDSRSGQANKIIYEFLDKTDLVASAKVNNFDEVAGAYVERVTAYTYDTLGRVTQVAVGATSPLVSQYTYFATGDVQTFTDPSGKVEKFLPDALGRLTQRQVSGAAPIWNGATHQDFAGSATSQLIQEDGEGRFTTSIMDFAGRLRAIAEPGSTVMPTAAAPNQPYAKYFVYDGVSRVERIHTGADAVVNFVRDGAGRVLSRIRGVVDGGPPANELVSAYWGGDVLEWDALGRPTAAVSMTGVEPNLAPYILEQFTYDGLGRKTAESFTDLLFASLNRIESKYVGADPFRREVNYLHGAGGTADDLFMSTTPTTDGRLGKIGWSTTAGAPKVQLAEYSHEGGAIRKRRTFIPTWTLGNFDTTYAYDQYGRMTSIAQSFSVNAGVEFSYDNASNLVGEKYKKQGDALAEGDRFAYDEHHRLAKAWLNSQSMTVDPDTVAFKQRLTYGMDKANNRTQLAEKLGQAASETAVDYVVDGGVVGGTPPNPSNRYASVGGFALAYDSRGNTRRTKSSPTDPDLLLTYDGLGRVSEVNESVASSSSSAMSMSSSWGGELEGGELFGGGTGLETGSEVPMTVEGLNAMDAARVAMMARIGSNQVALLQRAMDPTLLEEAVEPIAMSPEPSGPGAGAMSMSSMQSSSPPVLELRAIYVYDAFNRRVARFVPGVSYFSYTWDGLQEAEEYRNLVVGSQYVWGEQLDELVAYRHRATNSWASYYVAEGGAHCPSRILDESGVTQEIQEYDPYGRTYRFSGNGTLLQQGGVPVHVGAVGNPFGWKGHRVDGETGLVYMRNRYYHTGWGRFLTQDPLGIWGDPHERGNDYSYVGCQPLTAEDRLGLQTTTRFANGGILPTSHAPDLAQFDPMSDLWVNPTVGEWGVMVPVLMLTGSIMKGEGRAVQIGEAYMPAVDMETLADPCQGRPVVRDARDFDTVREPTVAEWSHLTGAMYDYERANANIQRFSTRGYQVTFVASLFVGRGMFRGLPAGEGGFIAWGFGDRYAKQYGIKAFSALRKLVAGTGQQVHHLIEKRFAQMLGANADEMLSIVVTQAQHQLFTQRWRTLIGYGAGTANATRAQVMKAAKVVYAEFPEILKALKL